MEPSSAELHNDGSGGNRHKLQQGRKIVFTVRVVKNWSKCPEKLWDLQPWSFSKLDWTGPEQAVVTGHALPGRFDLKLPEVPYNLNCAMLLGLCQRHCSLPKTVYWLL